MFTTIKSKDTEYTFVTQQYIVGTYCIINGDPNSQHGSSLTEDEYHIEIRKQAIKNGDIIVNGTIIPHKDININKFSKDELK